MSSDLIQGTVPLTPPRMPSNITTLVEISEKLHEVVQLVATLREKASEKVLHAKLDELADISKILDAFLDDPKKPRCR